MKQSRVPAAVPDVVMRLSMVSGVFAAVLVSACASSVPPSRLEQYIGPSMRAQPVSIARLPEQRPLHAGLVVLTDTTAPDAAPSPPEEAVNQLAESLKEQISSMLPIKVEKIIPPDSIKPGGDVSQFQDLGRKHGVDYVLVTVVSSTEQEYPMTVFLGWTSHAQPGFRRDNWTLIEVALIEVESGRTLLRAEGRGWATLDRPSAPGINQWYPVVWLRPQEPSRRYWPPTYAGAPNTLRVIAMQEAVRRLVANLQDAWIQQRQTELQQARG
jgi:hypothetical protein